jgi:hypothetical protein
MNEMLSTLGLGLCGLGAVAFAGGETKGGPELPILFGTDPDLDQVLLYRDFNDNGSFNDPGETVALYHDSLGSVALSDPDCVTASPDDTLYVGDSTEDIVLWLNDADENGTATQAGEHGVYFDGKPGGNASGVLMPHVTGVAVRLLGSVWVSTANTSAGGVDAILRLQDLDADGDANDAGEAQLYYAVPGTTVDASHPSALEFDEHGDVHYVENGDGTAYAKGVYRLADLDLDGTIDPLSEVSAFFLPPALALPADLVSLDQDEGSWCLVDRANRVVWRFADADLDGTIDASTEASVYWSLDVYADVWDIALGEGGFLFLGNSTAPDRLHLGFDADLDGAIDLAETFDVYDDTLSPHDVDHPKGLAPDFHGHEEVGTPYCTGVRLCPCANDQNGEGGCANSTGLGGVLEGEGTDGVQNDDLEFHAHQLAALSTAVLFQGTTTQAGGAGIPFGDGKLCVGGSIVRLGVVQTDALGEAVWGPGLASQGGWVSGQTRHFQVWYRDLAGPCGTGVNMTNGLEVTFTR